MKILCAPGEWLVDDRSQWICITAYFHLGSRAWLDVLQQCRVHVRFSTHLHPSVTDWNVSLGLVGTADKQCMCSRLGQAWSYLTRYRHVTQSLKRDGGSAGWLVMSLNCRHTSPIIILALKIKCKFVKSLKTHRDAAYA